MNKKYVFSVQSIDESRRLDTFLAQNNIFNSRSQVQNLIKNEQVLVNGKKEKGAFKLKTDDEIIVYMNDECSVIIEPEDIPLDIVYEDEEMLVVNKPKEMLTHPTEKETTGTLVNALLYKYGYEGLSDINGVMRPGIVHRLDRNTSGLLMVVKTNKAHEFIAEQIKTKQAKRQYLAIVKGNFEDETGIIDLPIGRHKTKPEKMAIIEDGKPSITQYKVIESFKGYSFIELTLQTGRTHQIRVHMSHIGHPIVNDSLYNKTPFKVKTTEQVLQAYKLQFTSPVKNDIIKLEIDLDRDIEKVLKFLRSNLK
ncbi:RluA family pseudouridine synthase [bacterium]|nr:RluA family pseudouridine synthase [bacterium]